MINIIIIIERSSFEERVDHSKDSDMLPVAALTKEQLQQALMYLLKVGSIFSLSVSKKKSSYCDR